MPEELELKVSSIRHPDYETDCTEFDLWRSAYKGGKQFIERYLKKFGKRESDPDFAIRKDMSYNPAFAKSGINEVKNSIYSRLSEISRKDGDKFWREAVAGEKSGVDLKGSSMEVFMGQKILPELLIMGKVGIMIDKPKFDESNLLSRNKNLKPYLYFYTRENILSWDSYYNEDTGEEVFFQVLLRTTNLCYHKTTRLPMGCEQVIQRFFINEAGTVTVETYGEADGTDMNVGIKEEAIISTEVLNINRIPFVVLEISDSLMADIAKYQVALLNVASSDLQYITKANFPTYVVPYNPAAESAFNKQQAIAKTRTDRSVTPEVETTIQTKETTHGTLDGIRYPSGSNPPDYISPPTDPILASMKKQDQMKEEIRQIINLTLGSIESKHASAESKKMDSSGLESGLSYIGLELEYGENEVAKIWALFQSSTPATIKYPKKYELKSQADRIAETKELMTLKNAVTSRTFTKELSKKGANIMLGNTVSRDVMEKIESEIDKADYITADYQEIASDIEAGLVDAVTASKARGYDGPNVVPLAQKEHAERLKTIAISQTQGVSAARGVPDASPQVDKTKVAAGGNA